MNCYELLKKRMLDFTKVMVEQYYALGLTETDALIMIRLEDLRLRGETVIDVTKITPTMTIDDGECSERILALVNKGFITIALDRDKRETFSLDGTYKRLALVLDDRAHDAHEESRESEIASTVALLEREFTKQLSAIETEIVQRWYRDYNYTTEEIEQAVLKAKRNHARSVKYVDAVLAKNAVKSTKIASVASEANPEVVALFNNVYRKTR